MTEPRFVDITPEALKTPEGAKRAATAMDRLENANLNMARVGIELALHLRSRGWETSGVRLALDSDERDILDELLRCERECRAASDNLVRAVAGLPESSR